ncbi:MAG: TSUP family transporter [Acidimicrobiia bacterium]
MLPVDFEVLAVAWAVTAVAAAVHGTIGFGVGVLSVPVLSLVDSALAPVPQLLISLPMAALIVLRERRALDFAGVSWVLAGRLPGALLGLLLLKLASDRALDGAIAIMVLVAVVIVATGVTLRRTPAAALTAGVISGTTGLVASIGGPPLALIYRQAAGATIRSSLNTIFSIGIVINITARTLGGEISGDDITIGALLLPALFLGLLVGDRLRGRVEGAPLRAGILVVSALAALGLLVRSLV